MQSYIQNIISQINKLTKTGKRVLFFGENIDTGSKIAGLARGLELNPGVTIKNVGNCELTHCGIGLGILSDGGSSVLFVKQLDFMLLGLDQIVNSFNYIRAHKPKKLWGSFTIFSIICDQGYQGAQSSFSGINEIASLANAPLFCINTAAEASKIIDNNFISPGFRIICLSQKYLNEVASDSIPITQSIDGDLFKYSNGKDITIASFGFALRSSKVINNKLEHAGLSSDLFHINFCPNMKWDQVINSCLKTKKLLIVDDTRSILRLSDLLLREIAKRGMTLKVFEVTKNFGNPQSYGAHSDELHIDIESITSFAK